MKKGRHYSEQEIQVLSKSALGLTFKELAERELTTVEEAKVTKGSLGGIIEEALFGIEANGESEPDFIDAGIELKVTPYKINKNKTLAAKERLVLNMIDFNTEYKNEFDTSHFLFKNKRIQIIWYLYEANKERLDFKITHEKLLEILLSEDIKQIEEDWYTIINKIKAGKAHEISEGDTMYLGACPKGANKEDTRTQPFSDIRAMRRAFCFKSSYMTQLVRKYIGNYEDVEKFVKDKEKTFDEYVNDIVNKYKGKTVDELKEMFNVTSTAKDLNGILVNRMFNIKGSLGNTEEFMKANIIPRTIRIQKNGRIKESFPFPAFKYTELVKEEWENSKFRNILEVMKIMFFVFEEDESGNYRFKGFKLWNMPETDIENYVKPMWLKTKEVIETGNIVKCYDSNNNRITNFPGMQENPVCHVRPHARNAMDTFELPVKDRFTGADIYTKHCFWLNNKYIEEIIKDI